MKQYIDKATVLAEIKRRIDSNNEKAASYSSGSEHDYLYRVKEDIYKDLISFLNTLEVKEVVDSWHLQEKEDIYDVVKDWSLHTFACIMKDGTIQKFTGCRDEDYEGNINVHIDGVNDDYDNVDDIVKWTELQM